MKAGNYDAIILGAGGAGLMCALTAGQRGRRVLVVDDVWTKGRNSVTVANRIDAAGGIPEICVLHYKPSYSLYPGYAPTYYAAVTDAYIIYPWELDRGPEMLGAWN